MSISVDNISEISQNPGVYLFKDKEGVVLYVGKATNLRSRVRQYFAGHDTRDTVGLMMPLVADVETVETDSVLEALFLEANLIKKYLPKYNIEGKDDKSWAYIVITKEDFPRILILRGTDLHLVQNSKLKAQSQNLKLKTIKLKIQNTNIFGPYLSKKHLEIALKIMRRIFPIHTRSEKTEKGCLDFQIGLCSGPYAEAISKEDYRKNIRGIKMILEGKKKRLVSTMEREMKSYSKRHEFEKAAELRNKLFSLKHIHDVALISKEDNQSSVTSLQPSPVRIEGYDISNIGGQHSVGSMVVFENGEPKKSEYRKFRIKTIEGADDVGSMKEVLARRFNNDWPKPDLIVLDGGQGHLNMASGLLKNMGENIPIVVVSKGPSRKNFQFSIFNFQTPAEYIKKIISDKKMLVNLMNEAHRFAITYHKRLRGKSMIQ